MNTTKRYGKCKECGNLLEKNFATAIIVRRKYGQELNVCSDCAQEIVEDEFDEMTLAKEDAENKMLDE